jgi:hypothetical protein
MTISPGRQDIGKLLAGNVLISTQVRQFKNPVNAPQQIPTLDSFSSTPRASLPFWRKS